MSGRVVLYARVSDPTPGSQDEERQLDDLRRAAKERAWVVVEEVREKLSGTRKERPGLSRVLELADSRSVDVVGVTELSRLTRLGVGELHDLIRRMDGNGVHVFSLTEPWANGDGALRDLLLSISATFARIERETLVSRTKSGMAYAKSMGKRIGRPPRLTPELLHRIQELRDVPPPNGTRRTWNEIARIVHHPAGSLKKWYSASRGETPRVINPHTEFGVTTGAHVDASGRGTVPNRRGGG
jgi:DNA invertase Pin-like site-specific DNA recombinase